MNVDLSPEMVEDIVERWLKDTIALGESELERDDCHVDDQDFWDGFMTAARWILENNWPASCPE